MAHNLLGAAYLEKKMLEKAELEIKKALEMRPRIPDAHYNLADMYNRLGQTDKYHEELQKGRQLQQKLEKNDQQNNLR